MNNQTENSNTQTIIIQKGKDATIAYLLWIIFGTLGAHRFYLGRFRSAIAQLILTIVGSIFAIILIGYILLIPVFIWWLFDGYLTYQMVSQENEKVNSTNTTITGTINKESTKKSSNGNIIEISELNKWYGDFHALKNINLNIKEGEIIVVCGPSGSGKSTLIRCVNFLEKFQEGQILVDGTELTDDAQKIRKIRSEVSMVFQHFNLFPHLTIVDNLTLAPIWVHNETRQEAREKALKLLDRVGIKDQAEKYPNQLSGGQQQRVAIARSLCTNPKIMLFDEPTSALDPEMISEVLDVMIELANEGITMICVTHEMGFARKVANRIIFMDDGQIVEENDPENFFNNAESGRLQLFLNQILTH